MKKVLAVFFAVVLAFAVCVPALAEKDPYYSPSGEVTYNVDARSSDAAKGKVQKTVLPDGRVKIVAVPVGKNKFTEWTVIGNPYDIVEGDKTTAEIVIKPGTDLVVIANFGSSAPGKTDEGETSPQTQDNAFAGMAALAVVVLVAAAGVVVAKKRSFNK